MAEVLSRRSLINLVGRAGGAAAAYQTMAAMGLLPIPSSYAGPPTLPAGNGISVVILGAGIAGMVAAYELGKAGYNCRILEARDRPGGRNWTLRAGDVVKETDSSQRIEWEIDEHLYLNPGPARIPQHHQGILGYCRELGVPVEVIVNDNRGAYLHDENSFGGTPQRIRAAISDERGYTAELAAKAVDQAALGDPPSQEDKDRLRAFLKEFGALDQDLFYKGSSRRGYSEIPGAGQDNGRVAQPLDLRQLLRSSFWRDTQFGESFTQAATMLQPRGGMGRIGELFGRRLGRVIIYNASVTEIRRSGDGARIHWSDLKSGATHILEAPRVLCTIPFSVLSKIENDFSPEIKSALSKLDYIPAAKVAFEANNRFWETVDQIYGGISWTNREITQIWYPSSGFHKKKGILVGGYIWTNDLGAEFAAKPLNDRLETALASGERVHPRYRDYLSKGISVAWSKIPFSAGAWADWSATNRKELYPIFLRADGPFYFAGEHLSYITGWQEGAVRSAQYAITQMANAGSLYK
jgi:monoamine oxidase